ncbi:MAG: hypothetical protein WBL35_00870 [Ornithinibacter sp.]
MSEADKAWRVTVGDAEYEVEVEHSTMTGKVVVTVDGHQVGEGRLLFSGQKIPFVLGTRPAVVAVSFAYAGFGARSKLHVDGRYVEPLRR